MAARVERSSVISGVSQLTQWWINQRMQKLRDGTTESMAVNPFVVPILWDFHVHDSFSDLGALLLDAHLMVGHATGFGKLVDEKLLPRVFGTTKLTQEYRNTHDPLSKACYDDTDHIVQRPNGKPALLSMKASKWTIQLAQAVNLNRSFSAIRESYDYMWSEIVVGVYYGQRADLTDKYDILRGINRGADHRVTKITDYVRVLPGREFWSWLNGDEPGTQEWVMEGVLEGIQAARCRDACNELMTGYRKSLAAKYDRFVRGDGSVDWLALLVHING